MAYATKEGTFTYLKKFSKYNKDFFRYNGEYFVSSLGLGTFRKEPYREENYVISYKDAVKTAIENGINVIDTAINYRYQVSEQEIGEALEEIFEEGKVGRESLVITSKAGFIPLEFPFPENPYEWIEENILNRGLASKDEVVIDQHCMSPEYLRWSVEKSLDNLKLDTLDILYLHNPETQLGYVDREAVLARIKEAFMLFESLVQEGKIRAYGIAAWNAFLYEEGHTEYLSLSEIVKIAQEVGGISHHFKYLQVPFNLAKPHAYSYSNQMGPDGKYYTLMQAAHGYGLGLFASSSLLQMNLFKGKFSEQLRETLETENVTDVATALQFARSGNVLSALFGSIEPQHVKDNLMLAYLNEAKPTQIQSLFGVKDAV
ncbi:aldo/keto reductase [Sulfurovum sp. zt1-1]|uniref:Aldo/keto reductase n=1 Tax=Sulfurovum zhangzhouensis TaxID=3019067 RepID=A0ABT7QVF2_9BACT|nr:aldo/keto reductase [Sulfurovum zhangzhouensis]MDM5270822.1 aldo/keto reductase [Sulfurovum zhangzhouensis]